MAVQIRLNGIKELQQAIGKRPQMMATEVKTIVAKNGAQLKTKTMQNMAGAYTGKYSRGYTKKSVDAVYSQAGMTVTVAPHTEYFPYLEYGTRFMSARPTLKPAFMMQQLKFVADLKRLMK
ncbi:hypothetical protein HCY76_07675 [Limosilactobacillus fermentum]